MLVWLIASEEIPGLVSVMEAITHRFVEQGPPEPQMLIPGMKRGQIVQHPMPIIKSKDNGDKLFIESKREDPKNAPKDELGCEITQKIG